MLANHLVDERFEIAALVFRLAGHPFFLERKTKYQRKLDSTFAPLKNHPAVQYVKENLLEIGCDSVWMLASHLRKEKGSFVKAGGFAYLNGQLLRIFRVLLSAEGKIALPHDFVLPITDNFDEILEEVSLQGYVSDSDDFNKQMFYWAKITSGDFLSLLSDFYMDSDFQGFFRGHEKFYIKHSRRFTKYVFELVFVEWFSRFGTVPTNFKVALTPTIYHAGAFGGHVFGEDGTIDHAYSLLPLQILPWHYTIYRYVLVHEFCHPFTNPIAEEMYAKNIVFKEWCDDSVKPGILTEYLALGLSRACEYVTRAYTILYFVETESGDAKFVQNSLAQEKIKGFQHIEEVYSIIQGSSGENFKEGQEQKKPKFSPPHFRLRFVYFLSIIGKTAKASFVIQVLAACLAALAVLWFLNGLSFFRVLFALLLSVFFTVLFSWRKAKKY